MQCLIYMYDQYECLYVTVYTILIGLLVNCVNNALLYYQQSEPCFMLPIFYVSIFRLGLTFFRCNTDVKYKYFMFRWTQRDRNDNERATSGSTWLSDVRVAILPPGFSRP